jgi:hypothetical protein
MKNSVEKLFAYVNIYLDNGERFDLKMYEWEFDIFINQLNEKQFGLLLDQQIHLNVNKIVKVVFDWKLEDETEK